MNWIEGGNLFLIEKINLNNSSAEANIGHDPWSFIIEKYVICDRKK